MINTKIFKIILREFLRIAVAVASSYGILSCTSF